MFVGTKDDLECSGMGLCEDTTGICKCAEGYQSSNGDLTTPGER